MLDDAFQHRWVEPGLSILLIDFNRPLLEDYMLPYGELRENMDERRRANIIVITKTNENVKRIEQRIIENNLKLFPYQTIYFTTLKYGKLTPVFKDLAQPTKWIEDAIKRFRYSFLVVTGISQPEHLVTHLKNFSEEVIHLQFFDHHYYNRKDTLAIVKKFNAIENNLKIIITTEKDYVRIADLPFIDDKIKENLYYVPLNIEFLNNDPMISGIIVQVPLPEEFEQEKILKLISPEKDVDGFNGGAVTPPTIAAIIELLKLTEEKLTNKKTLVIGHSDIFTQGIEKYLKQELEIARVDIAHEVSSDCASYDIVIMIL